MSPPGVKGSLWVGLLSYVPWGVLLAQGSMVFDLSVSFFAGRPYAAGSQGVSGALLQEQRQAHRLGKMSTTGDPCKVQQAAPPHVRSIALYSQHCPVLERFKAPGASTLGSLLQPKALPVMLWAQVCGTR